MKKLPRHIQEQVYVPDRDGLVPDVELRKDGGEKKTPEPTELDIEI